MEEKRKKVVAFTAGRRGGNCEIFVKTALEQISQMGIDVELIRLHECELHPCTDCINHPCLAKSPRGCIWKDDGPWLWEKFLESDGYLLASPVWSLSPPGIITDFRDRVLGPKMDVAGWELDGKRNETWNARIKMRPGALISVGGALSEHWTYLGMPTLFATTFSAQTNVVDTLNVHEVAGLGEALLRKDYMLKAKYLGQNLAHAVLNPQIDWEHKWLGGDNGEACPGCHTSAVVAKPGRNYVECIVCGRKGYISLDKDGNIAYRWPDDPQDRLTFMGKYDHMREVARHAEERYLPYVDDIQDELKRFREMEQFTVTAPSREKKKAK